MDDRLDPHIIIWAFQEQERALEGRVHLHTQKHIHVLLNKLFQICGHIFLGLICPTEPGQTITVLLLSTWFIKVLL